MTEASSCHLACVLREPLTQSLGFVAWYLDLGVDRIELFFDDPEDPAIRWLEPLPQVTIHRCTPALWRDIGTKAEAPFVKRQNAALSAAYAASDTDWFLAVDCDEFIFLGDRSIGEFLASIPAETPAIRFTTAERTQTPGQEGQWFRIPVARNLIRQNCGEAAFFLAPRGGLVGHADGKSATRTRLPFNRVRPHWIVGADGEPIVGATVGPAEQALLLHFFEDGYDRWRAKLDWRAGAWGFPILVAEHVASLRELPADEAEAGYRRLYDLIHQVDPDMRARLQELGAMVRLDLDPLAGIDHYFPQAAQVPGWAGTRAEVNQPGQMGLGNVVKLT